MNQKKIILLLILLLLLPSAISDKEFFHAQELKIKNNISTTITIQKTSQDYALDYVSAVLNFFPKDSANQKVLSYKFFPEANKTENSVKFHWDSPDEDKLSIYYESKIKTNYHYGKVREKFTFPITDYPEDLTKYTEPTENIDSGNDDIIRKASELVKGEDDAIKAVFRIGKWVDENINYSLDTLTAESSQKASWVLKNRYGVCDEITTLFIAMLRSIGIPAKYVSGVAYTNYNNLNDFGPHAWAEVWLGEWVPFDITYSEFAYIDATHLKLNENIDSQKPSVEYEWLGRDIDLKSDKLKFKTEVIEKIGKVAPFVKLTASLIKDSVGFGSYNLAEVKVKNSNSFYVITQISLSKSDSMEVIDNNRKTIILKPGEGKSIYWLLKMNDSLDKDYIYTIPLIAYTQRNFSSNTSFKAMSNEPVYTLNEMSSIKEQKEVEEIKTYSTKVFADCRTEKEEYYIDEDINALCTIRNIGNVLLEDLNVCIKDNCKMIELGIMQEDTLKFSFKELTAGNKDFIVNLKNDEVSKTDSLKFKVNDIPKIEITNLTHPENVRYNEVFNLSFLINKLSMSNLYNVSVIIQENKNKKEWNFDELSNNREFILELIGKDLNKGPNKIIININFMDKRGIYYAETKTITVNLTDVSFFQSIALFFRDIVDILGE